MLSGAVAIAGLGNYATNALLARRLDSEAFGDAALIVTLMLVITALAGCMQLLVASRTARVADLESMSITLVARYRRYAWVGGGILAGVTAATSPVLSSLLNTGSALPFVIFAAAIPFQLVLAVDRGQLQGNMRFGALSRTFVIEMAARLSTTWILLEIQPTASAAAAGVTASFVVAVLLVRIERDRSVAPIQTLGSDGSHLGLDGVADVATLLAAQMLLANADLIVAKAVFTPAAAGTYAVVALVGRALLFCGGAVTNAVFPLSARDPDALTTKLVVARSTFVLAGAGAVVTAAAWLFGGATIQFLFDGGYADAEALVGPFMLGTSALVVVHLLAAVDVAAGRVARARMMLAAGVGQVIMIGALATSLEQVVWTRASIMVVLLAVSLGYGRSRQGVRA